MDEDNIDFLAQVSWNSEGLVPAIAQDHSSGRVLMMAWMNRQSLRLTLEKGRMVYWSRSRGKLWRKGESSGHLQLLREMRLDCDGDTLLLSVEQVGNIACHTGRNSCFYRRYKNSRWETVDPIIALPQSMYPQSNAK